MNSITIVTDEYKKELPFSDGQSVFDVLANNLVDIGASCAGGGRCGKCGAVISPAPVPSEEDLSFFTADSIDRGVRLTCRVRAEDGMTVKPLNSGVHMRIRGAALDNAACHSGELHVAVDIGTTTLALALVNGEGSVISSVSGMNPQRVFGADVISRISAACDGQSEKLTSVIKKELLNKFAELIPYDSMGKVKSVTVSANTAMCHMLLGLDCSGLGVFPFRNEGVDIVEKSFYDVFGSNIMNCTVTVMPGISTFVGADIVSGMYFCDMDVSDKLCLFVDLGTNAEMVLGKKGRFLVSSAAAGPAFEGGNILCGTGSIPGAVCSADVGENGMVFGTIDNAPVCGICGTGVVETAAALLSAGLMDETGTLAEELSENGLSLGNGVCFTAKDVRELQLAKSAVRAGMETLMSKYGVKASDIDRLYIAGGFGSVLNAQKAAFIGLIPPELVNRTVPLGNSSLMGAVKYAVNKNAKRIRTLKDSCSEIELSNEAVFTSAFMEHMYF